MIPYGRHSTNMRDALKVAWQIKTKSLTQGSKIAEFERKITEYTGARFAVAVSSATAGLHIAVLALDLPAQSCIITSPISFVASSNSILYANHKPIFVDVNRNDINLDFQLAEAVFESNSDVRAIIPVHFAGRPCNMATLKEKIANKNIHVIEDAAHAFGARYDDGSKVGSCSYSDMTVFSLHPVKSITTGEGGVVTTNSYDLYKKLIRLRSHGINKLDDAFENDLLSKSNGETNPWYYEMQELGFNYRLTEIQSVLGISQLKRIDEFIETRAQLAQNYRKAFAGHKLIFPAQEVDSVYSANHIFPLRINFAKIDKSRREVMTELHSLGIGTQVHYIPIPLHPFYAKKGFSTVNLPEAMSYYHDTLTIPLFPTLRKSQQRKIVRSLEKIITS